MSSGPSTPTKAPKAMSSRLLTMKFMQRAAASSKPSSPISLPGAPEQPSPKRRKTGDSSPMAFNVDSLADHRAIQAALEEEEAKRQAALDRQAAEAGDTRWILNFATGGTESNTNKANKPTMRVVSTGFATIDKVSLNSSLEAPAGGPSAGGRRSFGKFNRIIEKLQDPEYESSESESSGDDAKIEGFVPSRFKGNSDDEDTDDDAGILIKEAQEQAAKKLKAERKAKRKSDKAELARLAEKRKKKDVNLNDSSKLNSISSGGGGGGGNQIPDTRACYVCGQVGHLVAQCPKRSRREQDDADQDNRPHKSRKIR